MIWLSSEAEVEMQSWKHAASLVNVQSKLAIAINDTTKAIDFTFLGEYKRQQAILESLTL